MKFHAGSPISTHKSDLKRTKGPAHLAFSLNICSAESAASSSDISNFVQGSGWDRYGRLIGWIWNWSFSYRFDAKIGSVGLPAELLILILIEKQSLIVQFRLLPEELLTQKVRNWESARSKKKSLSSWNPLDILSYLGLSKNTGYSISLESLGNPFLAKAIEVGVAFDVSLVEHRYLLLLVVTAFMSVLATFILTCRKVPPPEGMTTCNKAQANTSRPEEARLRLPDPVYNLPRDGEPLASPFLASPSCLLT